MVKTIIYSFKIPFIVFITQYFETIIMLFHEPLMQFKIGGASINIPDTLKPHLETSFLQENLIEIPSSEKFPIQEQEQKSKFDLEILRKSFVEFQLEHIRDKVNVSDDSLSLPIIDHPVIELDGDFKSLEDFLEFKKAVAIDYKKKSNNFGFKEPIGICASPICINPAIPGFQYCTYHLPEDKNFNQQIFLKRCTHFDENGQCKTPCSSGLDTCTLHSKAPIKKKGNFH